MTRPFWVAGSPATGTGTAVVRHSYDGSPAGEHHLPGAADIEAAVAAADTARHATAHTPAWIRAAALDHVSGKLIERAGYFAELITAESAKPIKWARAEVRRAASTFRWASEEARRFSGELQRLDAEPAGAGRLALVRRVPRGPVLAITPFNFPLNLVAHKLAPAIAAGAPIVVKPAPATPLTALALGELLAETELPAGSWSILPVDNAAAGRLVTDPRLPVVSFTGSVAVGWSIRDAVPRKHVTLELGGNAAAVVCADWTDLDGAAQSIATHAMCQAGQSCVSVQRVYAHVAVHDLLLDRILAHVHTLGTGDPRSENTDVGPLINHAAADRVQTSVGHAVAAGAHLHTGGRRDGATCEPTVLGGSPEHTDVMAAEVFGPVVSVNKVTTAGEAIAAVNRSRFGLQAGVFTQDLPTAFAAAGNLDVGAVIIGDVPSFRADQLPYGGVKDSGTGREGPAAAIADLTEERVTVLTGIHI